MFSVSIRNCTCGSSGSYSLPATPFLLVLHLDERRPRRPIRVSLSRPTDAMKSSSAGAISSNILPTRSRLRDRHRSILRRNRSSLRDLAACTRRGRHLHDLRPSGRDGVERERVLRPAILLGDREQQERELLDELDVDRAVGPAYRALAGSRRRPAGRRAPGTRSGGAAPPRCRCGRRRGRRSPQACSAG